MRFSLVLAVVALVGLAGAAPSQAQNGVDGKWTLTFETPMGSMDASATFKTEGDELTGTMESQAGSTSLKGTVKGRAVNFTMNIQTPQGDLAITLNADYEGDEMKGTFDFGQGIGNWTGKRTK